MMKKRTLLTSLAVFLILGILFSLSAFSLADAQAAPNNEKVKVFIGFTKTPGHSEQALVRAFGGEIRYSYHIIPAISAELPLSAIDSLRQNPNVTIIEPVIEAYLVTDYEPELSDTWGVEHIGAGTVHVDDRFGAEVKVAVLDTGINYEHVDLADNYQGGYDTGDEYNEDPMDTRGHGTHVAGTIAALRNETGVVGAAPGADLYALKISDADGRIYYDAVVAALEWAGVNGILITNNSYGSKNHPGGYVEDAFTEAYDKYGMLHVAAAGNSGNPRGLGDNVIYPAGFSSVIAVAASDSSDERARWSSTGPAVELIAPGVSIYSTLISGDYGYMSGTSMAAPHVAGVAALVWAANSGLTNGGVRIILQDTAQDLMLSAERQGFGLVRADLAVAKALNPPQYTISVIADPAYGGLVTGGGTYTLGDQTTVTATKNDGYSFLNWTVGATVVSNNENYTFTVAADRSLVANFKKIAHSAGLSVTVELIGSYTWNTWVDITIFVVNQDAKDMEGATVEVTISDPNEVVTAIYQGITDFSGTTYIRYRIANKASTGDYTVNALASMEGFANGEGTATFEVTGR